MRAFYEEQDENRVFYVKIDNINVENSKKGYKTIEAKSGFDLLEKVIVLYKFNNNVKQNIQLWSTEVASGGKGIRLDNLTVIPNDIEFVYIRGVIIPTEKNNCL